MSHERDRNVEDGGKRERRNKEGGGDIEERNNLTSSMDAYCFELSRVV